MHVIILQRNMWYFYFGKLHLAYRFILVFRNSFFYFARRVGILNVDRQAGWNISNNGLVRKLQLLISGIPAERGAQKPNVDMWSSHKWCLNCLKLHKSVLQHILVVLNCVVFHQIKEGHRWPGSFEVLVHRSHSHYRGINKNSLSKICIYYLFPPPALKNCTVGIYNFFFFAIHDIKINHQTQTRIDTFKLKLLLQLQKYANRFAYFFMHLSKKIQTRLP